MARSVRRRARGSALFAAALCAAIPGPAAAQDLEAWFEGKGESRPYAGIRPEAAALAAEARRAGVPDRLLALRLAEGAVKRAPADRLLAALREETDRLVHIAGLLRERRSLPVEPEAAASLLAGASLLLRSGIAPEELAAALDAAAKGRPVGGTAGSAPEGAAARALAGLSSALAAASRFSLDAASRRALAMALIASTWPEKRFDSLLSVFARGRAAGSSAAKIHGIVVEVLEAGGSLEKLERELQRRTRSP